MNIQPGASFQSLVQHYCFVVDERACFFCLEAVTFIVRARYKFQFVSAINLSESSCLTLYATLACQSYLVFVRHIHVSPETNTLNIMSSPMTKKIRSQSPDTTVAVGKGESMEEFECYKFVLAFASPFFDAMLSTDMSEKNSSRIELPDKDPEEWKLFYTFIDPSMIGNANHDATITEDVAMKLVPLFHEFQMESYVNKCDNVLSEKVKTLSHLNADAKPNAGLWDKDRIMKRTPAYRREALTRRRNAFDGIIELLQFACIYDLPITKIRAESCICFLLHELLLETIDLFDLQKVKSLVQLTLPLNEVEIKCRKQFVSLGKSEILWDFLTEKNFEWRLSRRGDQSSAARSLLW